MTNTIFERVLQLAAEEREARETRPLSAAMIKAAEAHKARNREKYLHTEGAQYDATLSGA